MKRILLVIALCVLLVGVAEGQATRTWVSGVGDDANPCSRTAPCKTYAGAISKTAAGGEISVLDPGGYGAVTITKSIMIQGTGTLASALNSSVNGVVVNGSGVIVVLRDLAINGAGSTLGVNGVRFINGSKLVLERVSIQNQSNHCVAIENTATVHLTDVTLSNCSGAGFSAQPTSPPKTINSYLNNVRVIQNGSGVTISNGGTAHIFNSVIAQSTNAGVTAIGDFAASTINILNSSVSANGTGIIAGNNTTTRLSNSYVTNNTTGFTVFGTGGIISFQNNTIVGNGGSQTPTGTLNET